MLAMMYDCILIGSGPIHLLEALYLSKQGKRVLVVEEKEQIGGAWATVTHQGLPPLEIGCHIWDIDKKAYAFLRDHLHLNLQPLSPSPAIVYGRFSFPYDWKNMVFLAQNALKHLSKLAIPSFFKALFNSEYYHFSIIPSKYYYPEGGAAELMHQITAQIAKTSIDIVTNASVETLSIDENKVVTVATKRQQWNTKEVVMTSFSAIKSVHNKGEVYELPEPRLRSFIHAHLVFEDNANTPVSYVRLMKHPLIHRVSDITHQLNYTQHTLPGKKVLLVGVHEDSHATMGLPTQKALIISTLHKYFFVGKSAKLLEMHWNTYPTQLMHLETIEHLTTQFSCIRQLHSVNFIHGIAQNCERWQSV